MYVCMYVYMYVLMYAYVLALCTVDFMVVYKTTIKIKFLSALLNKKPIFVSKLQNKIKCLQNYKLRQKTGPHFPPIALFPAISCLTVSQSTV